jgi:hypothetical protein
MKTLSTVEYLHCLWIDDLTKKGVRFGGRSANITTISINLDGIWCLIWFPGCVQIINLSLSRRSIWNLKILSKKTDQKPRTICFVPLVLVTELLKTSRRVSLLHAHARATVRLPTASSLAHTPVLSSDRLLHLYKLATPQGKRHTLVSPTHAATLPNSKLSTVSHGAQLLLPAQPIPFSSKPRAPSSSYHVHPIRAGLIARASSQIPHQFCVCLF